MYAPHRYTHQGILNNTRTLKYPGWVGFRWWSMNDLAEHLAPLVRFQTKHSVLVCIGEFGVLRWAQGRDTYLADVIGIFESHGWSWFYWSVGGYEGWDPDYETSQDIGSDRRTDLIIQKDKSPTWSLLDRYFGKNAHSAEAFSD